MVIRRAFLTALLPVLVYLLVVEALYCWYEVDLAGGRLGLGVLVGGVLSGVLSFPGAALLDSVGLYKGGTTFAERMPEAQGSIFITAGMVYLGYVVLHELRALVRGEA